MTSKDCIEVNTYTYNTPSEISEPDLIEISLSPKSNDLAGDVDPPGKHPDHPNHDQTLTIHRKVYTQQSIDETYTIKDDPLTPSEQFRRTCSCSKDKLISILLGYVPIVSVIRNYSWKNTLLHDLVSGLSTAFLMMPMGMALALLASLPPAIGLYTSFFPVIFYVIFGTSRHVSMGTNALLSLMTATVVERELASRLASFPSTTSSATLPTSPSSLSTVNAILSSSTAVSTTSLGSDVSMSADDQEMYKVGVATSISFICGILLLTMGLLRCGFISNFMSTSFLGGFTTAAGFHIFSSQIAKILHIKISAQSGAGKLVKTYISIFSHVTEANAADVIIGAVSIAFLLVLTFINEKYKQHMKVPIPTHLILVVIATVVSHFADFKGMWDIAVVGRVATGFRTPAIPPLGVMGSIAMDAVVIAVMAYALTIAMAKMMSKQHSYPIDDDQELVAYGLCNLLGAFFSCQPNATAPPRTMLLSLTGARSTLCGVPVAAFICVVIMAAGSLFENLPVAVLAAMIMTAVKNLLMQVLTLPSLWRISKPDFLIWVVTCLVGVFADLDYAIIVGVFGSVLSVVVATQLASSQVGGVSATEDLILSNHNREGITPPSGTKIFYFPSPLYFANAEKFKNELYQKILDPTIDVEETIPLNDKNLTTQTIVIDCSAMTYADIAGINILKLVSSKYQAIGVKVYLSKCPEYLLGILRRADFFSTFPKECVVYGVFDALLLN